MNLHGVLASNEIMYGSEESGEKLTTAKITKAHIRAWRKGLKTLYYTRIANAKIIGQQSAECVSCAL